MNITKGPVKTAIRVGIYGTEGVGKTTLASKFPRTVFIDVEGGSKHMDVRRFDQPESLNEVKEQLDYVVGHPEEFGTVVIDTVDALEKLIFKEVCQEKKIQNIEDIGYGKGYVYAKQKMQGLLELLDVVIQRGVHVVLICHSMIRKFELPDEMGSYDRYMLKLNEKNIAPLVKEWVDLLLFINYKTDIVTDADGKTKKGKGGQKRIMYTTHNACWDAKNRFGLPDELPLDYDQIANLFKDVQPTETPKKPEASAPKAEVEPVSKVPDVTLAKRNKTTKEPPERPESMICDNPDKDKLSQKLWELMLKDGIEEPLVIQAVVAEKGYYDLTVPIRDYDAEFIDGCLIEAWETVSGLALTKIHDLPF